MKAHVLYDSAYGNTLLIVGSPIVVGSPINGRLP